MSELSLTQLRRFCAVAELGSIAAAAERERVAPTAIGATIVNLETAVNTKLLIRKRSRGTTLTASGHQFYRAAKQLIRDADDLLKPTIDSSEVFDGPLQIGVFGLIAPYILPPLLTSLGQSRPETRVEFVAATVADLVDLMNAGELHCFFSYKSFSRESGALPRGLAAEELFHVGVRVLLAPEHPLAAQDPISLEDLKKFPAVSYESNPHQPFSWPWVVRLGLGAQVKYQTSDFELMRSLVARGLGYGIALMPLPTGPTYEGRELVSRRVDPEPDPSAIVAVRPVGRWRHPAADTIIKLTRQLAENDEFKMDA